MDDHSARLHAAHLRIAWADGDKAAIAHQIAYIADLWDAQDILCALLTLTDIPVRTLREFLENETAFPEDEELSEGYN